MSENAAEGQQGNEGQQGDNAAPPATPADQNVADLPEWARNALTKANGEAAKYRTQVRDLEPRAKQFSELEESRKTEQQRQTEAVEAANRDRDTYATEALRYRVALEHGLTKDDITRLGGANADELEENAKWLADIKAKSAAPQATAPPGRPQEQYRPGATPTDQLSDDDRFYESIYPSK